MYCTLDSILASCAVSVAFVNSDLSFVSELIIAKHVAQADENRAIPVKNRQDDGSDAIRSVLK